MKNFEARNGNCETSAVVKNPGDKTACTKNYLGDCWQWKANGQCSRGDNCSFRHDTNKRAKSTQPNPSPRSSTQQSVRNASRTRSPRGRSPSAKNVSTAVQGLPQRNFTPLHSVKSGILQNACSTSPKNGCRFGEKCSYAHRQVDEQPSKKVSKRMVTKVQWLC